MRRAILITVSTVGGLLLFLFVILLFEPVPPVATNVQAQVTAAIPIPPATVELSPTPTVIGYTPPPPEAIATLEGFEIVPWIGPETAGTTLHIGPKEEISVTLPPGFELDGMVISDFCMWPPDLHDWCMRPFWLITDGEYYVRLEISRMRIVPDRDLLVANPDYLSRFQWLIDVVGQDKVVDIIWLMNEMENASPERWEGKWLTMTPTPLPTASATVTPVADSSMPADRESAREYNLYLPIINHIEK